MRYLDSQVRLGQREEPFDQVGDEPWVGEPPAVFTARTTQQLFQNLDRDLRDVEVLRVVDSQWLACEELRREFEALLASFRARGGRVEFSHAPDSSALSQ